MGQNSRFGYELIEDIKSGQIKVKDIVEACIQRIRAVDDKIKSFTQVLEARAIKKASELDKKIKENKKVGRLYGLPIAVKECISVKDSPTTCCSKILEGYVPPYDATVIDRLIKKEDGICLGRTNMDEFAMGSSTENSALGPTYNPWSLDRVPGGSSGGAAACISADETILSLGSDTGGSVRCPAAFCGVVGLKPTYGRVSRYGLVSYANSLEQIGPLTKCVYDSALMLEIMAGKDPLDSTTTTNPVDNYTELLKGSIEKLKIGVPKEFFGEGIDKTVATKVNDSVKELENFGAEILDISLPNIEYAIPTYYIIALSEASSNLARFDGLRYGPATQKREGDVFDIYSYTREEEFGDEVRRRIILGTYVLSAGYYDMFYMKALKVRTLIKNDFLDAFKKCDVLVGPTMPTTAFKIGELVDDPLQMYMLDILTCPINIAGIPSISIPCSWDNNELPIGFQIMGNYFDEKTILKVAFHLEQKLNIYKKKPEI